MRDAVFGDKTVFQQQNIMFTEKHGGVNIRVFFNLRSHRIIIKRNMEFGLYNRFYKRLSDHTNL